MINEIIQDYGIASEQKLEKLRFYRCAATHEANKLHISSTILPLRAHICNEERQTTGGRGKSSRRDRDLWPGGVIIAQTLPPASPSEHRSLTSPPPPIPAASGQPPVQRANRTNRQPLILKRTNTHTKITDC